VNPSSVIGLGNTKAVREFEGSPLKQVDGEDNATKKDYTHISIILDRSGSMQSIRDDIVGGFNSFLGEQQTAPGQATLSLVQFDSTDPYEVVHQFKELQKVPELTRETFVPRGATPLLDALGRGINDLESQISGMEPPARPSKVVVVVITDGQENASQEFSKEQIQKMIENKQKLKDWQFVFLSADLDAIKDALAGGFKQGSTLAFDKTVKGTRGAWNSVSKNMIQMRCHAKKDFCFEESDRQAQKVENHRVQDLN
jgi:hypothetical protein